MEDFFDFSRFAFGGAKQGNIHAVSQPPMNNINNCIDSLPLTMAYVPFQSYGVMYEPDKALCRGTVFPDLDKPFLGCKCDRRDAR